MTPQHDDHTDDLYMTLAGVGLVGLVTATMIVSMLRLVDVMGPRIGDVISFNPAKAVSPDSDSRIPVTPIGDGAAVPCVLDVRVMVASGGSVAIEATLPEPNHSFRVHWAGARTSDGRTDCGTSAEFLLSPSDLVTLIMAADR